VVAVEEKQESQVEVAMMIVVSMIEMVHWKVVLMEMMTGQVGEETPGLVQVVAQELTVKV